MGSIVGSICKTISIKCVMAQVSVEALCVLSKTEPGHSLICLPIPHCNDEVQNIDTEAKYFIDVYMYNGYLQVVAEETVFKRLALFTPEGKRQWKVMSMGALNAAPTFVAIMMNMQMGW